MEIKWVSSSGGPLVFVPVNKLDKWSGVYSKETFEPLPGDDLFMDADKAHYGEVCEIDNLIGRLNVDGGEILAFCDDPNDTVCVDFGCYLYFIRHVYSEEGDNVTLDQLTDRISKVVDWENDFTIEFVCSEYVLFDSVEPGFTIDPEISQFVNLKPGLYQIQTGEYKDSLTNYLMHRASCL
jgi:Immunity protein 21